MIVNDDLNEMPPNENYLNGVRKPINCINETTYKLINEKKNYFQSLKLKKEDLIFVFNEKNKGLIIKHELIQAIISKKMNIAYLKDELSMSDAKINRHEEEIRMLKNRNEKKIPKLSLYAEKIERCKEMVKKSESATFNKTNNERDGFNILKLRLIEYEKLRIDELNRFVFDLSEIKPKLDEDILQKSTRTALKDARQTVYVNGRWIWANDHVLYRIVRSILPSDGDYLSYLKDSQQKDDKLKDDSNQLDELERQFQNQSSLNNRHSLLSNSQSSNSATGSSSVLPTNTNRHAIISGLTYTVQFVNLIAFYLNIVLPYNLPHSKFCTHILKDNQFQNAVAKLNTNIVFLSIQQNIQVTNLLPKHTLENLYHFLTNFKEMRIKLREKYSIAFPSHLIPLLEDMFTDYEEDSLIPDSMPNLIFNDNDEWENIQNSNEIPSDDTYTATGSRNVIATSSSLISSVFSQFFNKQKH